MNVTCEHCGAVNPSAAHDAHQISASCLTVQLKRERAEVKRLRDALARIAGGAWPYSLMRIASDALKGEGE